MKVWILAFTFFVTASEASDLIDIRLQNGRTYHSCEAEKSDNDGVKIRFGPPSTNPNYDTRSAVKIPWRLLSETDARSIREQLKLKNDNEERQSKLGSLVKYYWIRFLYSQEGGFKAEVVPAIDIKMGEDPNSVEGQQSCWVKDREIDSKYLFIFGDAPASWKEDSAWILPLYNLGIRDHEDVLTISSDVAEKFISTGKLPEQD